MGTNYYLDTPKICTHCGRSSERIHIGKSSAGWVFALHIHPDRGIRDLEDYIPLFEAKDSRITDEYHKTKSASEMLCTIMARAQIRTEEQRQAAAEAYKELFGGDPRFPVSATPEWYKQNHAEPGPMGLARGIVGTGHGPVRHGTGTWDCYEGEEDSW